MKIKITLIALLIITSLYTKAQTYVTIPDANFAAWLNNHYGSCMNGNQMDITCSAIINEDTVNVASHNISDLTGIQYFTHLKRLWCGNNHLTNLPVLPNTLQWLYCWCNQLTALPSLPNSIQFLDCSQNHLTTLPVLPDSLEYLECANNYLTSLPALPNAMYALGCDYNHLSSLPAMSNTLLYLRCEYNQLISLPALPSYIQSLWCSANQLTSLPTLPNSLSELWCWGNILTSLPALPNSLVEFICNTNQITTLPALPNSLVEFNCSGNQITILPVLPNSLVKFNCSGNQITILPALPDSLRYLNSGINYLTSLPSLPNSLIGLTCNNNYLTNLPLLPDSLEVLYCWNNQLTSLPVLPVAILELWCDGNQITSLPPLPNSLLQLICSSNLLTSIPTLPDSLICFDCYNNNISCFPVFPNSIDKSNCFFDIGLNPFTCLPNYINAMDSATLAYPLCVQGNFTNNPNGCFNASGLSGYTYKDNNTNCLKDSGDQVLVNIPIKLFNNNNYLLAQMYSFSSGVYDFVRPPGLYSVALDTAGMTFTAQCSHPGIDSAVTITTANPLATDVNFSISCKPGFDVGVQSVVANGLVFPGQQHALKIVAGDMSHWYNLNCGAGVSGQIVVTVTGPVTYLGPAIGALTPLASGNVFTYTIADFGSISNSHDFGLLFETDTTAQGGDVICVNVSVAPAIGDNNISNNTYQYCYLVVNSLDPNMKEVYPVNVLPGYEGYLTYTIHFQNTGSAPAINIFLTDTLSGNLDLETFKVINYSHNNIASLTGRVLTFRFPNIMLPDSSTDEPGSKGFVQYKIKPKGNLVAGAQIKNTAYIYFDYNAPIATNTAISEFSPLSIEEHSESFQLALYPNPVLDYATLIFTTTKARQIQIKVLDMLGQELLQLNKRVNSGTNTIQINTQALSKGFYVLSVRDGSNEMRTLRFVK